MPGSMIGGVGNDSMPGNHTGNATLQQVHHHRLHPQPSPEEMRRAMLVFYLVLLSMFGFQTALVYWRRKHQRSYELTQLLGLWLVPATIAVHLGFWRFLAAWLLYSAVTAYFLHACTFGKMDKALPKRVYTWFHSVFKASIAVGVAGYGLLILQLTGIGLLLMPFMGPQLALTALWYGLYFGILARDCAEIASGRIASMLGTGRKMAVSVRDCGICGGELADSPGATAAAAPAGQQQAQKTVQLSCKHLFHDDCIRGWTIVGKKDTCPTCWEKVDLRSLYADRPWETSNLSWIQMLDMVRYLVVWNPVILVGMHFFLHATHLDEPFEQHHLANGTLVNATHGNLTTAALGVA